jgi:hypothetical protein
MNLHAPFTGGCVIVDTGIVVLYGTRRTRARGISRRADEIGMRRLRIGGHRPDGVQALQVSVVYDIVLLRRGSAGGVYETRLSL